MDTMTTCPTEQRSKPVEVLANGAEADGLTFAALMLPGELACEAGLNEAVELDRERLPD